MVECPSCGEKVEVAVKSWPVAFLKQNQPKVLIGIFECPKCKSKFRSRIDSPVKPVSAPKISDLALKVKSIQLGLIQTKKTLHDRINTLQAERSTLMLDLGDLEKDAESRADELEDEICQLREKIRTLKELLGTGEDEPK